MPCAAAYLQVFYTLLLLQSQVKVHKLRALCSAIAHWSPDFGRCEFIPSIVFPFILAFRTDDLGAFETILTVLLRFGSPWLAIFPQLPLTTFAQLAGCLGRFDPKLSKHLKLCGVDVVDYGWVLLRSAFSEVLRRDDWLRLWDHLFSIASADSDAIMWAAVAIVIAKRSEILDTTDGNEIFYFSKFASVTKPTTKIPIVVSFPLPYPKVKRFVLRFTQYQIMFQWVIYCKHCIE